MESHKIIKQYIPKEIIKKLKNLNARNGESYE